MKAIGVSDLKMFCRIKMLSILKKQIKSVLIEVRRYLFILSNYIIFHLQIDTIKYLNIIKLLIVFF